MQTTKQQDLHWFTPEEQLPEDLGGGYFSPDIWLALSDGRVVVGQCLHKNKESTTTALVHSWFYKYEDGSTHQLEKSVDVLWWAAFTTPTFPVKRTKFRTR